MDRHNAVRLTALHLQKNTSENSETNARRYSFLSVDWWKPTENRINGIHGHLVLSSIAYQAFRVREGHIARSRSISLVVRDNLHFPMLKNSNTGVGGAEIDSNCWSLRHIQTRDKRNSHLKTIQLQALFFRDSVIVKRQRHVTKSRALPSRAKARVFLRRRGQPEEDISRARTVLSPRFLCYQSLMEKRYLAMRMR